MRVLVLCDGGGRLGIGHVMRSLALAEAAVTAGHDVVVAGRFEGPFLRDQLLAAPVEVVPLDVRLGGADPQQVIDLVQRLRPEVLHVDCYELSQRLAEHLASAGGQVVVSNVEDGTYGRRPADVVVDSTFGAELSSRPQDGSRWLLRGSRYTPVRRRVIDARRGLRAQDRQVARSVLVVMGGTDPVGLAPAVVALLARTGLALAVSAIAVGENAQRARTAAEGSALALSVLAPLDDVAGLMSGQDLVVSAAGTSVWELCCIGVPTAVVWAVDNQREGYERVTAARAAIGLGGPELAGGGAGGNERAVELLRSALTDSRARGELAAAGRSIVDGLGAWRVVRTWEQARRPARVPAAGTADLVARPATLQDALLLWQWRNDPATRAGSRSSAEVPWDDHLRWLRDSLARTDRLLFVAQEAGGRQDVGTVRWDRAPEPGGDRADSHEWEVSITVAPGRRGQSFGRSLLRAAELALAATERSRGSAVSAYLAAVHIGNAASMRLFETSGYLPDMPPDPQGFMRFRKTARVP